MKIGKIFYIFNFLLVIKLLMPCLCDTNKEVIAEIFENIEKDLKNKKRRNLLFLGYIVGAIVVGMSIGFGFSYYNTKKNNLKKRLVYKESLYAKINNSTRLNVKPVYDIPKTPTPRFSITKDYNPHDSSPHDSSPHDSSPHDSSPHDSSPHDSSPQYRSSSNSQQIFFNSEYDGDKYEEVNNNDSDNDIIENNTEFGESENRITYYAKSPYVEIKDMSAQHYVTPLEGEQSGEFFKEQRFDSNQLLELIHLEQEIQNFINNNHSN